MAVTKVRTKQQFEVNADTSFSNFKITSLATPTADSDAATKAYVDATRTGLDAKQSVRAASTATVTVTYSATGGTSARGQITAAPNTLDGVTLAANDRILLKDQTTGAQNGIWVVTTLGTGANGVWDRATDFDSDAEVTAGAYVWVEEGTTNADSAWVLTTNNPIIIGGASGTALVWVLFSSASALIAGAALTKTANTLDVNVDNSTIEVNADALRIKAAGVSLTTHVTGTLPVANGGTGATTLTGVLIGNGTSAVTAVSSTTALQVLRVNGAGNGYEFATVSFGGGTVTSVSVVSANGFAGTVATASTTPAITISTTITGVLKGNGTAISAAVAGTDYQAPITLTTTGNSGAATFTTNTLNIPNYTLAGLGGFANPMTTLGDMIYGGASGAATRLPNAGTTNGVYILQETVSGGAAAAPSWLATTGSGNVALATSASLTTPSLSGATISTSATVTAGTNAQGQGALTSDYNVITTATANPSGVTLPTATTGRRVTIVNKGANPINVYPATGAAIDALGANVSQQIPVNGVQEYLASSTTQWYSDINSVESLSFVTGTLGVSNGGSGASTLTGVLIGNGTSAFTGVAGTGSQLLRRNAGNTAYEFFTLAGTDINTAFGSQTANFVYAAPNGSAGNPTFRALVAGDIPALAYLSSATNSTQSGYFGDIFLFDDSTPSHYLGITNSANLTAARTLSINVNDANRTLSFSGDLTLANSFTTSGNFALTLTTTASTNVTLPTSGTLVSSTNYIVRETPSGTPNGSLTTFGLANTPVAGKEMVFVNGVLQNAGSGNDYQLSGSNVVFETAAIPQSGDIILVTYLR